MDAAYEVTTRVGRPGNGGGVTALTGSKDPYEITVDGKVRQTDAVVFLNESGIEKLVPGLGGQLIEQTRETVFVHETLGHGGDGCDTEECALRTENKYRGDNNMPAREPNPSTANRP